MNGAELPFSQNPIMRSVVVSLIPNCRALRHITIAEPAAVVVAATSADSSDAGKHLKLLRGRSAATAILPASYQVFAIGKHTPGFEMAAATLSPSQSARRTQTGRQPHGSLIITGAGATFGP